MKNTFGQSVSVTIFGESHGEYIGAVIDGLAPGIVIDEKFIAGRLSRRRPSGNISTSRAEQDRFSIVSGVFDGNTTGAPLCILIPNTDRRSSDYLANVGRARPGHADYSAYEKYFGFEDYRGGGHFSGRITAALVAAGAVAELALKMQGILVGTHILRCAGVDDVPFSDIPAELAALDKKRFPALSASAGRRMKDRIEAAAKDGDSVGGIFETAITGIPAGVGEPWFDTLEGVISHIVFAIPAVKGIQFGAGFALADMRGSRSNDAFFMSDGKIMTKTNNAGGINGGITNGMPVIFSGVIKPTPSIAKEQETVSFLENRDTGISVTGRHDPAIIHRACPVVSAAAALAVCDMMAVRYGTDFPRRDISDSELK